MWTVVVLEDAVEDIRRARDFYENIAPGVGRYCAESLLKDLERLADYHGIHAMHFGFHRMLASRFPFAIYYRDSRDRTEVLAVLDLRRDPNWLRRELGFRDR